LRYEDQPIVSKKERLDPGEVIQKIELFRDKIKNSLMKVVFTFTKRRMDRRRDVPNGQRTINWGEITDDYNVTVI
jgi:hypothetical protein